MGRKGNGRNLKHDLSDAHMQEDLGGWQRRQGKPRMGKKVVWRKERVGQPLREGNSKELKIQKKKTKKKVYLDRLDRVTPNTVFATIRALRLTWRRARSGR